MKKILLQFSFLFTIINLTCGQAAPNFIVTDSKNSVHNLYHDYLNEGKTVVIKIFFVGCPPCSDIAPHFQELYEEWGEGDFDVEFFEMSKLSGDSNIEVKEWSESLNLSFPSVGSDGGSLDALEVYLDGTYGSAFGTPTFIVIAPDGTVNYGISGAGVSGKIQAIDNAIEATGALRPEDHESQPINYVFDIKDAFNQSIEDVIVSIGSANGEGEQYQIVASDLETWTLLDFNQQFPGLEDPTFFFSKDPVNPQENISVSDLVIMIHHILGNAIINDPHLRLAADANNDGSVSILDLSSLIRIILGDQTTYPNGGTSWKFDPPSIPVELERDSTNVLKFKAIRTGDLNNF